MVVEWDFLKEVVHLDEKLGEIEQSIQDSSSELNSRLEDLHVISEEFLELKEEVKTVATYLRNMRGLYP